MPRFRNVNEWIEDAKEQFNNAMDNCKKDSGTGKKKVKIRWKKNPQQTVEVEPDLDSEFEATN